MGRRQSGLAGFKMANLIRDVFILQKARAAAFAVLQKDPNLRRPEHQGLRNELLRKNGPTALAGIA
jgi:ATP-dependent DNA helicase RecG